VRKDRHRERFLANAPPPIRRGAGTPVPDSLTPSEEGKWSAGRRQGFGRPLEVAGALLGAAGPLKERGAHPRPRGRAPHAAGLRGPPPRRCASRRSTAGLVVG